jgi:hypothetical protein
MQLRGTPAERELKEKMRIKKNSTPIYFHYKKPK